MNTIYKSNIETLKDAAEALSYTATYLPGAQKAKRLLISNGKKMFIANSTLFGFYPEVQRWQQHLFDSKILTQVVLKQLGYNTIASFTAYCNDYPSSTTLQKEALRTTLQYPVIVKPEEGERGRDISVALTKTGLALQIKALYEQKKNFLIQPVLTFDEYRILLVNGKIEVIHMKQLNHIVGDGIQTIKKLLHKKPNGEKDDTFVKSELKKRGLNLNSILAKNDTFTSHLTRFSAPEEYYESKKFPKNISQWAEKLSQDISVATIGIDIFAPHGLQDPDAYIIIELNANPAFEYFHKRYNDKTKIKEIATKFLKHYFKK